MLELNKIYNMDCIEWMKLIPEWSIDCIITDPPYWTTACKRDTIIPFDLMREQLKRIIKPNGAIVLFWSEPFSSALRMSNIKQYKYDWKWRKTKANWFLNVKKMPLKDLEDICVFYAKNPTYNPQWVIKIDKKVKNPNGRFIEWKHTSWHNWWRMKSENYIQEYKNYPRQVLDLWIEWKPLHPTQKPVALIEYLVKTYTNEWETVLDFTMWSWTTAVACLNTNRNFIWFELDRWYREAANKRLENRK